MNKIILQLNEDHHRLSELLNLLDEQMSLLDSDEDFDCKLTLGILEYIKYYPDVFHHPLEELIFDYLTQHRELQPVNDKIRDEHTELAGLVNKCRTICMQWQREGEISDRVKASELGKSYIDAQRKHMALEERDLFPRAAQILTEADWKVINDYADVSSPSADPVFGPAVIERYRNIRDSIQKGLG